MSSLPSQSQLDNEGWHSHSEDVNSSAGPRCYPSSIDTPPHPSTTAEVSDDPPTSSNLPLSYCQLKSHRSFKRTTPPPSTELPFTPVAKRLEVPAAEKPDISADTCSQPSSAEVPTSSQCADLGEWKGADLSVKTGKEEPSPAVRVYEDLFEADYMFIVGNPKSGGGSASLLLKLEFNYAEFILDEPVPHLTSKLAECGPWNGPRSKDGLPCVQRIVKVVISDITEGPSGQKPVFQIIKAVAEAKRSKEIRDLRRQSAAKPKTTELTLPKVRIMVAGGDGTVMWAIQEMDKHRIHPDTVLLGVVPFGTGNDFAQALGSPPHFALEHKVDSETLRDLVSQWIHLQPKPFDVWGVQLHLDESLGFIKKVDGSSRRKTMLLEPGTKRPTKVFSAPMGNYFSIGVESRIGLGFDRNRMTSPQMNKVAYAIEGVKKMFLHRTRFIDNIISTCEVLPHNAKPDHVSRDEEPATPRQDNAELLPLFRTIPRMSKTDRLEASLGLASCSIASRTTATPQGQQKTPLLKPCVSLLFLNIPSFAGGLDLWRAAHSSAGLEPMPDSRCLQAGQSFGDGMIEMMSFSSLAELSLSNLPRIVPNVQPSAGMRICQSAGDFVIKFREEMEETDRMYFQVDGEYFQCIKPTMLRIFHSRKVRVLCYNNSKRDRPWSLL